MLLCDYIVAESRSRHRVALTAESSDARRTVQEAHHSIPGQDTSGFGGGMHTQETQTAYIGGKPVGGSGAVGARPVDSRAIYPSRPNTSGAMQLWTSQTIALQRQSGNPEMIGGQDGTDCATV